MSSVKGDHKYLDPIMLYELHSINVEIVKAKERLREITNSPGFDYGEISSYFTHRRREFAEIGLKVSKIADALRTSFKVPGHDDWNPRDTIIRSINIMNRKRAILQITRMERKSKRVMSEHRRQLEAKDM